MTTHTANELANVPHPAGADGEPTPQQWNRHKINDVHRTMRSLLGMYPATEWSLEESMVVRGALYEIAMWRQRGIRGEQLVKAADEIEMQERTSAKVREQIAARLAGVAQCDLRDEDGFVVDKDGKWVLEDGYEVACYHGEAVDLD
jgi:hypothetical protein